MGGLEPQFKDTFKYKVLKMRDSPNENISRFFNDTIKWIVTAIRNGGSVFIHCWAGVSRSSTIAIAYLIKEL
jgi:protein-tyrosine phosphatase